MKKNIVIKVALFTLLISSFAAVFTGCNKEKEAEPTATPAADAEVEQDFIVVGADEDGVTPLIFYNLNMVSSVEELEEYVDLSYDFDKKPELLLAQYEAPEGVFEQIMEMLDEKGVVYTIIEE